MTKSYQTKIVITDKCIRYYTYSKPILTGYEVKRESYEKRHEGEKELFSLYRARDNLIKTIDSNCNEYSKFITLTFKENIIDRDLALTYFKIFKKNFKKKFGYDLKYAGAMERQFKRKEKYNLPDGVWHFHLVCFNSKKLDFKILKECWSYGSVDIKKVDSPGNVSIYIAKYLTQDNVAINKKAILKSRNLKSPTEVNSSDLIIPQQFTYHNHYVGYLQGKKEDINKVDVDYYEVRFSKLKSI